MRRSASSLMTYCRRVNSPCTSVVGMLMFFGEQSLGKSVFAYHLGGTDASRIGKFDEVYRRHSRPGRLIYSCHGAKYSRSGLVHSFDHATLPHRDTIPVEVVDTAHPGRNSQRER